MMNAISHETYNTLITFGAMGVFVSAMVAFYYALTYTPTFVVARFTRRKRS